MGSAFYNIGDSVSIEGNLNIAYGYYEVHFEYMTTNGRTGKDKYFRPDDYEFPRNAIAPRLTFRANNSSVNPFVSAERDGVSIPFSAEYWEIDLSAKPVPDNGSVTILVKCKPADGDGDFTLTVGDSIDSSGDVSIVGDAKYKTKLYRSYEGSWGGGTFSEVITFDPKTPLVINNFPKFETFRLIVEAIEPNSINGASCNGEEVIFTPKSIDHTLTESQLPPNPASSRRFLITAGGANPQPTLRESINLNYKLDKSGLKEFQKKVFDTFVETIPGETKPDEAYVWTYVSNLYLLPFQIPEDQIFARELIQARNLEFNAADRIVGDYIYVDLGNIAIPEVYKNSLDYVGSQVELYVPFKAEPISLDAFQVIGETIKIQLVVGVSHGDSTLNVSLDNGELISTTSYSLGSKYPFFSYRKMVENDFQLKNVVNSNRKAYVTVKRADYSDIVLPLVEIEGKISDEPVPVKGRVIFDEIKLDGIPYADEHSELMSKLKSGVIFK